MVLTENMNVRKGQCFGNYQVLQLLGRGGFAEVYLGEHLYLATPAALKVLTAPLDEQGATAFLREARALASLIHPLSCACWNSASRTRPSTSYWTMPLVVLCADVIPEGSDFPLPRLWAT